MLRMRILLNHLYELNRQIRELDDDIDHFMKPEEKQAVMAIQDIPGIGETSAQFARISFHRGKKQAYVAVAHSMLIAIYHIIKDCVILKDLGADYYTRFNRERKINAYLKKLKALGWEAPVVAA